MSKMLQLHQEALKSILKGVKTLAQAVTLTLGPGGCNVVIRHALGSLLFTKNGVTVAQEIVLKNKFENMGAQLVKEACSKTAERAGDGSTTAIVLAEAILSEGVKAIIAGANPVAIKQGIDQAVTTVCKALDELAKKITTSAEIEHLATVSANQDKEIGAFIAQAMEKVGKDGIISISEAPSIDTTLEVVEGLQFEQGYLSPYFMTHPEKMVAEMDAPFILITDQKLSTIQDVVPILETSMRQQARPLLIIAGDIEAEALATLIVNKVKAGLAICGVKAPACGEHQKAILQDLALFTGGTFLAQDVGLSVEDVKLPMLGKAKKAKIGKDHTTLIEGAASSHEVQKRRGEIRAEIARSKSEQERKKLAGRLAQLAGRVALLKVGAATPSALKEKKARFEDALRATQAAILEGTVPGGGVALLRAVKALDNLALKEDEQAGANLIFKACFAPAIAIANNCGKQGNMMGEKIFESQGAWGYNGLTDEFADLHKDGVIDPVLVTKSALKHAASISSMLLTVSALITDTPELPRKAPPPSLDLPDSPGGRGMDETY